MANLSNITAKHNDNLFFLHSSHLQQVLVIDLRFNDGYLPQCTVRTRTNKKLKNIKDAVDGRNSAPIDKEFLPLFLGFYTSQVMQDFLHQQYHWGLPFNPRQLSRNNHHYFSRGSSKLTFMESIVNQQCFGKRYHLQLFNLGRKIIVWLDCSRWCY